MNRKKTLMPAIGAGLLLVMGLTAGSLMAGDAAPFKAEMSELTREFEPGRGRVIGTYTQTFEGLGTLIGKFTATSTTTLTWVGHDIRFEGQGTMVAANGDELYMQSWGRAWDGNGEGWFAITGGTGRFEGATGSGSLITTMGDDDVQTGVFEGELTY